MLWRLRHHRSRRRRGAVGARRLGVTLLEVTLAMGLLVVLSSMTFWFYANALETRTEALEASGRLQLVRTLLNQMSREIRYASSFTTGYGTGIQGGKESIKLYTTRLPRKLLSEERSIRDDQIPGEFDLMEVQYYIGRHDEIEDEDGYPLALGLIRKETRTLHAGRNGGGSDGEGGVDDIKFDEDEFDDLEDEEIEELTTVKEELYAPNIKFLRFHYFDGARWWADWDIQGANTLPQIVRITVGFEGRPPADDEFFEQEDDLFLEDPAEQDRLPKGEYTTFVRVLQSDIFFGSRITRTAIDLAEQAEEAEGF